MKPRQVPPIPKRWKLAAFFPHFTFWAHTTKDLEEELPVFWDFARECLPGLASPSLEPSRGTANDAGGPESATERAALKPTDMHVRAWRELGVAVRQITDGFALLRHAWGVLRPLDPEVARVLVEDRRPERGKTCDNESCQRWIAGGAGDPIRAGRCTPCAAYWKRNGKDRSKELVEEQVYREAG